MQRHINRRLLAGVTSLALSLGVVGCSSDTANSPGHGEAPGPVATSAYETPRPEATTTNGEFAAQPSKVWDFSKYPDGPLRSPDWTPNTDPVVPTYNDEKQVYTDNAKNVRIEDDNLVLEAHREHATYPGQSEPYEFTSGRVETINGFRFSYGKLEATMILPKDQGTWPAFWLLSANQPHTTPLNPTERDWQKPRFYMNDGEVDGIEAYGKKGADSTVHTYARTDEEPLRGIDITQPHTYGVELTPTKIVWTVDGKRYHTFEKPSKNAGTDEWPFQKNPETGEENQLYLILNLAMGGTGGGEIDPALTSAQMKVSSIKFYEYTGKK